MSALRFLHLQAQSIQYSLHVEDLFSLPPTPPFIRVQGSFSVGKGVIFSRKGYHTIAKQEVFVEHVASVFEKGVVDLVQESWPR